MERTSLDTPISTLDAAALRGGTRPVPQPVFVTPNAATSVAGSAGPAAAPDAGAAAPPQRRRRHRVRIGLAIAAAVCLVAATALAVDAGRTADHLATALARTHLDRSHDTPTPPPGLTAPTTFLVLGWDTRDYGNGVALDHSKPAAGQGGTQSDAMALVRVFPTTGATEIIGINRDLRVDIPGHGIHKIDAALTYGSMDANHGAVSPPNPSLSVRVVEGLFGIHIDHTVIVDFDSFTKAVDTVGGVDLTLPQAQYDIYSGLDLAQGTSHVGSDQALAFVRSRHTWLCPPDAAACRSAQVPPANQVPDMPRWLEQHGWVHSTDDDTGRMLRQQIFFKALWARLAAAGPTGMLADLNRVATNVRGSVWVDDQFDVDHMIGLAAVMAPSLDNVVTATTPYYEFNVGGVDFTGLDLTATHGLFQSFVDGTMQQMPADAPRILAEPANACTLLRPAEPASGQAGSCVAGGARR